MPRSEPPAPISGKRVSRREVALVAILAVLAVGLFAWDAGLHGALDIPRDDDWSYLKTAFTFYDTGVVDLNGWAYTTLVGQLLLAWPLIGLFGGSIVALEMAVAVVGALGIVLCYLVLRRIASAAVSGLATFVTVAGPIFGTDTVTFMTDVPVLTLQMLTLLLGCLSLQRRNPWPWLVAATACGVAAFSIRQSGIVALFVVMAVVGARWWTQGPRIRPLIVWVGLSVIALLPIYAYRQSLPNGVYSALDFPPFPRPDLLDRVQTIARAGVTLALLSAPALLLISPRRLFRRSWQAGRTGTVIVVIIALVAIALTGNSVLGNHVHPFGDTWMAAGEGSRLLPLNGYRILLLLSDVVFLLLALTTWVIVAGLAVHVRSAGWRSALTVGLVERPAALLVYSFGPVMFAVNLGATAVLGAPFIDRYLIATVPFTVVAVVNGGRWARIATVPVRRWVVGVGCAAFAVFGFMVVDFAATVDGAKWDFARRAVADGVPPQNLDAGVEWFGYHQGTESGPLVDIPGRTWWTTRFPAVPVCQTIQINSAEQLDHPTQASVRQVAYPSLFGHDVVLTLVNGPDGC